MKQDGIEYDADFSRVQARYGLLSGSALKMQRASSGFSAADVWQATTAAGVICVRRWPMEHPGPTRLAEIHAVLRRAFAAGCAFVPLPLATLDGNSSFVAEGGRLWEVTPWMPGRPDDGPTLSAARRSMLLAALAKFHVAVTAPLPTSSSRPSPGLVERRELLVRCLGSDLIALQQASVPLAWAELLPWRDEYLSLFPRAATIVEPLLTQSAAQSVTLQPCIRDIRREHVLFTADEVTGWVDYGALRDEHPAADVARVCGEFCDDAVDSAAVWHEYATLRGNSFADPVGQLLVDAFIRSGILLSPYNWFRWILLEGRDFGDRPAVLGRIDELLRRLRKMVEST